MEKETLSSGRIVIREKERVNGWSCPPHPFQVVAWFFVVAIPLVYYGTIVSHLPDKWIPAGCIIPGAFLLVHVIFHLICLTVDPADPVIRKKRVEKATEFDRSLHRHVIENFHCYICQVDVGRKSKHCALCNKCISEFDHHCKWLNNCIGGQNYKLFLSCLSAALATALSFLAFCLYPFIMFIIDKTSIMNQREWGMFGELNSVVFITLTSIIVVFLVFAILLLGHLLCFHIFLIRKGLSTYDFIIQNRQAAVATSEESQSAVRSPNKLKPCKGNKVSQQRTVNEGESGIEITMKDLQRGEIEIDDKL